MSQLTSAVLLLLTAFYGDPASVPAIPIDSPIQFEQAVNQPITLEEHVREYFKDEPILAEIARCESRFRHLGASGRVIRGELVPEDVGVMQINEFYHEDRAKKLGFDLHTLDGNLAYAKWLYAKEGTAPWVSSSKCWQKSEHLADAKVKSNAN